MRGNWLFTLKCIAYVAAKDLKIEARRKYDLISMITFAIISILVFGFASGPSATYFKDAASAVIWSLILFAAMLGFSSVFTREMDQGTINGLRMLPVSPQVIFIGKTLYGLVLMGLMSVVIVPFGIVLLNYTFNSDPWLIVGMFILGILNLAAAGAIVSAITMYTQSRTMLMPILMFPLVIPTVVPSAIVTGKLIQGATLELILPELRMIGLSLIVFLVTVLLVFDYVFAD